MQRKERDSTSNPEALRYLTANEWSELEADEHTHLFGEESGPEEAASATARAGNVPRPLLGLAISGGGIRSAAFGTGLLQALMKDGVLSKFHYLSTVSGGGYIGSSLSYFLRTGNPDGTEAGTGPDNFPFGRSPAGKAAGGGEDNRVLDYLRQHGNYLLPGKGLNMSSLAAAVLRAMLVSLFIYGGLIIAVVGFAYLGELFGARMPGQLLERPPAGSEPFIVRFDNPLLAAAGLVMLGFLVLSIAYGVAGTFRAGGKSYLFLAGGLARIRRAFRSRWSSLTRTSEKTGAGEPEQNVQTELGEDDDGYEESDGRYQLRTTAQRVFGLLLSFAVFLTIFGLVPICYDFLGAKLGLGSRGIGGAAASSTALGSFLGYLHIKAQQKEGAGGGLLASVRIYAGAALVLFGIVVGSFALAESLAPRKWFLGALVGLGVTALLAGVLINLNSIGLHRMYRDRLMEAFMPNAAVAAITSSCRVCIAAARRRAGATPPGS